MKRLVYLLTTSLLLTSFLMSAPNIQKAQALGDHDIGITQVTTDYLVAWRIWPVDMNVSTFKYGVLIYVTIFNYGVFDERFNVTVYADAIVIEEVLNVELPSGNSTTLTVPWDGSYVDYGQYVISAYAHPVQNETDTANNTFIDGEVIVTIPYDVNGDGVVNVLDLIIIATNLGRSPPPPPPPLPWRIDLNNDSKINVLDLIVVAQAFCILQRQCSNPLH